MDMEVTATAAGGEAGDSRASLEVAQNLKRNYTAALLDGGFFGSAVVFVSAVNILPLYVSSLTTSRIIIGLPMAIMEFGWYMPQLIGARLSERRQRLKPFVLGVMATGRVSLLAMVLVTLLLGGADKDSLLVVFLVAYSVFTLSWGAWIPPYYTLIGRLIPTRRRGSLAGWSYFISSAVGVAGTFLVRYLLDNFPTPYNFAMTFSIGITLFFLALISLSFVREPAHSPPAAQEPLMDYLKRIPKLFSGNRNYAKYVASMWVALFSYMGFYFFSVYAVKRFNSPEGEVGTLILIFLVSQAATTPLFGRLADRIGHKVNIEFMMWAYAAAILLIMFAQSNVWFYVGYVFVGISNAAYMVSNSFILLEFGPPQETQTYMSLTNTVLAPLGFLSPIIGGTVADRLGYPALFGTSLFFCVLAMAMLRLLVREPRGLRLYHPAPVPPTGSPPEP